ncbi:hypothetical protein GOODEAATRI_000796 [Goodea atripinnis]|uniref:Disintegrin and metalloproteinase domain-containing protein 10 n=1 Tax=Goodea atripinnis TaxID=208336 RepID=A0ABV0P0A6_9TELE
MFYLTRMCSSQQELHTEAELDDPVLLRKKRMAQVEKNTCQLFIQTDHLFFKYYKTRDAVIAQISSHVKAIDAIYQGTDFMGIRNISFMVKRIRINTTNDERDRSNPFRFANIGVEKFLELNSEQNHDDYCLAYVFTDRDFDDGVLGLAWVGAPSGSSGGICEKSKMYSDGKRKSLNTGIITVQNYASHVPPKVSHITFAHEVGHNFGSPIYFVLRRVGQLMHDRFLTQHLFLISPSQGPCCTPECSYKGRSEKCREESECAHQGMCSGISAQCPTSEPKANFTACHGETQVCLNGVSG